MLPHYFDIDFTFTDEVLNYISQVSHSQSRQRKITKMRTLTTRMNRPVLNVQFMKWRYIVHLRSTVTASVKTLDGLIITLYVNTHIKEIRKLSNSIEIEMCHMAFLVWNVISLLNDHIN